MDKYRIIGSIFLLLICLKGVGQKLNVDLFVNSSEIDIILKNKTRKKLVIGLQNWQLIPIYNKPTMNIGLPTNISILNFVFVMDYLDRPDDKFLLLDWEINLEFLPENSLKILEPNEVFKITLVVNDSSLLNFLEERRFMVNYVYSLAKYSSLKKYFQGDKEKVYYRQDSLVIANAYCNYNYIEKPSGPVNRFYNKKMIINKIDFTQIKNEFKLQIYKKVFGEHE